MKYLLASFFLLVGLSLRGQVHGYNGLEIYNKQILNPAFTITENKFQIDVIGIAGGTKKPYNYYGLNINSVLNLKNINSSVYFSTGGSNNYFENYKGINFGYAYRLSFSEKCKLYSGISINSSKQIENENSIALTNRSTDISSFTISNTRSELGIAMIINRLTLGATARINILESKQWDYHTNSDTTLEKNGYSGSFISVIYDFKPLVKINIQFSWHKDIYHHQRLLTDTYFSDDYLGLLLDYNEKFGIGFTFGDAYAIIGEIKINKGLSLRLHLYNNIGFVYDDVGRWNIVSQIIWHI